MTLIHLYCPTCSSYIDSLGTFAKNAYGRPYAFGHFLNDDYSSMAENHWAMLGPHPITVQKCDSATVQDCSCVFEAMPAPHAIIGTIVQEDPNTGF